MLSKHEQGGRQERAGLCAAASEHGEGPCRPRVPQSEDALPWETPNLMGEMQPSLGELPDSLRRLVSAQEVGDISLLSQCYMSDPARFYTTLIPEKLLLSIWSYCLA